MVAEISHEINKEIALLINRRGQIVNINVGDHNSVDIEKFKNTRESQARLCGLRCVHTHPGGIQFLSKADLTSLSLYRFDAVACIGVDSTGLYSKSRGDTVKFADSMQIAFLTSKQESWRVLESTTVRKACEENFIELLEEIEREFASNKDVIILDNKEKAILVSLQTDNFGENSAKESVSELEQLTDTAGAEVIGLLSQKRHSPDSSTYLGSGKAQDLALMVQVKGANIVIVDAELSARQQKNLEAVSGVKTIDRTELILDIFAQRAKTKEGKLQVELAQLKYLYPRLVGSGLSLSRQGGGGTGGGIATRGPGETKLEIDRRRIKDRINALESEVDEIKSHRAQQRKLRASNNIPVVAIVGYTNTGKSTLLNALSNSDVLAENKLFATLDPTTRKIKLPEMSDILLTDTVGFIQRLPTALVKAFRATLEEVTQADVILHVIDPIHPNCDEHIGTVYDILKQLDSDKKPIITVINKIDAVEDEYLLEKFMHELPNPVKISALQRKRFGDLLVKIEEVIKTREPVA
ncbi:MAG: GTPase HflX [bacterium]